MIQAVLTFDYVCTLLGRSETARAVIKDLGDCLLVFEGLEFKPGKMLVSVALYDIDKLDQPRHEGEGEELVQRELDKAGLSAGILIVSGTEFVDETLRV